ncbi:MAG TPA: HAD family hydrolase [Thermoplasmata archaeon]|nr:HAD family hydrolase [Thermoplasmata archaeon]
MGSPLGAARAVVFDLDETLLPLQTPARWQWAWRPTGPVIPERHLASALRKADRAWDRRRWRGLIGAEPATGWADFERHVAETLRLVADRPLPLEEERAVVERYLRAQGPIETFPDVVPFARRLESEGIPYAVLSPMPHERSEGFLKRAGIDPIHLVRLPPSEPPPPAKSAFRSAADALGVRPAEAVFVGDLYWSDVRASARAGMRAVLIDRDGKAPAASGTRIRSLSELPEVLRGEAGGPPSAPKGPEGPERPEGASEELGSPRPGPEAE